jgi:hypothetical protein
MAASIVSQRFDLQNQAKCHMSLVNIAKEYQMMI